jgi:hypothetical protein
MNSILPLADIVDQLLSVKASIAELEQKERELKDCLIATGETSIDGMLARASISYCQGREKTDWQTIAMRFNPSRQLIVAHTTTGAPFHTVRVSARKGAK